MSVYIKGMEMPKKCIHCELQTYGLCGVQGDKDISMAVMDSVRDADCPLVPVPDHGRLIDADALIERMEELKKQAMTDGFDLGELWYSAFVQHVRLSPTIIPASMGYMMQNYCCCDVDKEAGE